MTAEEELAVTAGGEVGATAAGVDEELWASYREGGHLLPEVCRC